METEIFIIENVSMDVEKFVINDFIQLRKNHKKNTTLLVEVKDTFISSYESNGLLFYKSLMLSIPEVNLKVSKFEDFDILYSILRDSNSMLLNYYGVSGEEIITANANCEITEKKIDNIKKAHEIIIEHNRSAKTKRDNNQWKPSRWGYSFQCYTDACSALSIDLSILSIITGLEALLVNGEGSLSYKVSLFASLILGKNHEDRENIFKTVKRMYNIRSKVVHGEISSVVKLVKKENIYDDYFFLKTILSDLLISTYNISEEALFNKIEKQIFGCPLFEF